MPTQLYIVPTPIGNLEDITLRSLKVLRSVSLILAEDTRTTGILLRHYQIQKPLQSYHIFNEHRYVEQLVARLQNNETMALVSDAGTPSIADPGFLLIRECLRNKISIECLPGATAFVPALVKSGLPSDRFVFEGFLPHKKGRKMRLQALAQEERTIILYESPHRLLKTLEQLAQFLGKDRQASVSRELTKIYEETQNDTLENLCQYFSNKAIKGEIVIVVQGKN
ncbi:MAG: 16S rRNA (cytidine(1402)-2'-O)-methyltransferase [Microscillaceae bacterium]|nr:16S rRNA (cytidine(1402)-2'-O)-methyltransferase [Microscillaceae bacterium]MDW8461979.1 16S rRNA (cytidine(1402)-2'-O)-methyltransferase [Cytophagales bacterium]